MHILIDATIPMTCEHNACALTVLLTIIDKLDKKLELDKTGNKLAQFNEIHKHTLRNDHIYATIEFIH